MFGLVFGLEVKRKVIAAFSEKAVIFESCIDSFFLNLVLILKGIGCYLEVQSQFDCLN